MISLDEAVPLPITGEEFDKFAAEIFEASGLPDNPSYRHAIATCIMHLDAVTDKKERSYFARAIRKTAANHVAFIKMKLIEKEEAEKSTPRTEDSDGPSLS